MTVKHDDTLEHVALKCHANGNPTINYLIEKQAPLEKLMKTYCERTGLNMASVKFEFAGLTVNEKDTPMSFNMSDGDTIEVNQK